MLVAPLHDHHEGTAQPVAPVTLADRCDAPAVVGGPNGRTGRGPCGAQGFLRAVLPSGRDLVFCAHHGREHESKLRPLAVNWHDETGKLFEPPTSER